MTLQNRTEMRRCGRRYSTLDAAEHSKLVIAGTHEAVACTFGCGGWHQAEIRSAPVPRIRTVKPSPASGGTETFAPAVAELIDRRDGDDTGAALVRICQRDGAVRSLHRHHRRLKGDGGSQRVHAHCACNGVTLCARCHRWVHDHPEQAMAEGWIVSQSEGEPGSVGVMRFAAAEGGATQWPTCSGEWAQAAPEAREAA